MKTKTTAGVLALFLGGLGVHRFYLGRWVSGLFYLVFCWTFVPMIVAAVEAIMFFLMSEEKFNSRYQDGAWIATPGGVVRATPETHVKCPDCRELVIKDARKCRHCGCVLVPQA